MTRRRLAMERFFAEGEGEGEVAPAPASRAAPVRSMALALGRLDAALPPAPPAHLPAAQDGRVAELDPALCDPSFVRDRIEDAADDGILDLAASIAAAGQAVPILVRPSPVSPGRYQIAYGHRRWRACAKLGRFVRAVVREISDDELVVAQGHENSARRDLTFIERAGFAHALVARGFSRAVVGKALGVDKSELARLIQVATGLPPGLATAIGRAPKAGRPRWLRLVALCAADGEGRAAFAALDDLAGRPSDVRFAAAMAALTPAPAPAPAAALPLPASVRPGRRQTTVVIDEAAAPGFGRFVEARLTGLFREFCARGGRGGGRPR